MQKIGVRMDYKDVGGNPFQEQNMTTLRSIVAHVGIWKVKPHVIELSAHDRTNSYVTFLCVISRFFQNLMTSDFSNYYSVISSTKYCGHKDGGFPFRCMQNVANIDTCEQACTDNADCVGISFNSGTNRCHYFPSQQSCPFGWDSHSGNVATNSNDLIEGTYGGYNCKAKKGITLLKKLRHPTWILSQKFMLT